MNPREAFVTFLLAHCLLGFALGDEPSEMIQDVKDGRVFSLFSVVTFKNSACTSQADSTMKGTCYTQSECTSKGGTSSGNCAAGFGVCCTFTLGCGSKIAENNTYFQSSSTTVPGGQCSVTICECSTDVCQLRLDFSTFVIAGPSTNTLSTAKELGGSQINVAGAVVSPATNCLTDTFSVTGNAGGNPPVICGTNTGYHMYAETSDSCNTLDFQLGPTGIGTTIPTRQWNIRITQISCFDANKAPAGCTQWFFGTTTGTVINSYNYAASTPYQLANQRQSICIRRERSFCRTCYSITTAGDFAISGKTVGGAGVTRNGYIKGSQCCNYGSKGTATAGYDCVIIPGAAKTAGTKLYNNAICGNVGLITATNKTGKTVTSKSGGKGKTICTTQIPFKLDFITDGYTVANSLTKYSGFKLIYWQTTC